MQSLGNDDRFTPAPDKSTADDVASEDFVTRADFDALKREVEDLKSRVSDVDDARLSDEDGADFGGLTRDEFLNELADAHYGKGVRPVRPGQFDVPEKK